MYRIGLLLVVVCTATAVACGGATPTGPSGGRIARISRTTFLAFGDSFTAGEVTTLMASPGGISRQVIIESSAYPRVLQSQLHTSYPTQAGSITVANQGKPGETILEGVVRFEDVFEPGRSEVVLLQEGGNHLGLIGPDVSAGLMRVMVQRAKNGNARVFVGSMVPTLPNRPRSQVPSQLVTYNNALRAMCTQEGVTFVDLYNAMLPQAEQLIGTDGLHPTEAGYRRIAELFFAAIQLELQER